MSAVRPESIVPQPTVKPGGKFIDLAGKKLSRLLILRIADRKNKQIRWVCRCDCGSETVVVGGNLKNGNTRSCGCLKIEDATTHGLFSGGGHNERRPAEYSVWDGMKQRCLNQNHGSYKWYGARGITVCERWLAFENFFADMGARPTENHMIERLNNAGNYEPSNVVWATMSEQANNTRRTRFVEYKGERMNLLNLSRITGIKQETLYDRIFKRKHSVDEAVEMGLAHKHILKRRDTDNPTAA